MDEVTKLVDGELKQRKQETVTIGDGKIVRYLLSEHQFETLGENNDYDKYLGILTLCLGIIIPMAVDLFPWENEIKIGTLVRCCVIAACLGVSVFSYIIYRDKKRKSGTTYSRLKEEARIITEVPLQ